MKKIILLITTISCGLVSQSQQLQTSSLYDLQGVLQNPSMAGVQQNRGHKGIAGVSYRHQWSGISGSPQTFTAFGSFALSKQKIGVAANVYNDKTGPTSRTG